MSDFETSTRAHAGVAKDVPDGPSQSDALSTLKRPTDETARGRVSGATLARPTAIVSRLLVSRPVDLPLAIERVGVLVEVRHGTKAGWPHWLPSRLPGLRDRTVDVQWRLPVAADDLDAHRCAALAMPV